MQNAVQVGDYLLERFRDMADRCPLIGDVRGRGFFLGIELVKDSETRAPGHEATWRIVNHLRENGMLLSTDGPLDNVLKFKPPMVFSRRDVDQFCDCLEAAFLAN